MPEGIMLTPEEWREKFLSSSEDHQLRMAAWAIKDADNALVCAIANHKQNLTRTKTLLKQARRKLAAYAITEEDLPPLPPYEAGYEDALEGREPRLLSKFATDVSAYIKGYDMGKADVEGVQRSGSSNT